MKKNLLILFVIALFAGAIVMASNPSTPSTSKSTTSVSNMGEPHDTTKCDPHKNCTKDAQGNCVEHKSCCKSKESCPKAKSDSTSCSKSQPTK
jgi:hypothetical protein